MLTVVIPFRNEDMIEFTVRRILASSQRKITKEIILVDDGSDSRHFTDVEELGNLIEGAGLKFKFFRNKQSVGNCYSRDRGIAAATYDAVAIFDAHLNFELGWDAAFVDFIDCHPNGLGCTVSIRLRPDDMDMDEKIKHLQSTGNGAFFGAHIIKKDIDSNNRSRIFPSIWNQSQCQKTKLLKHKEICPIGSILGGAYILRRGRYMDDLKRPWQHLMGWGSSEQTISLTNYLMGGDCYILPVNIGHMYRTGGKAPYSTELASMIFNQLFLANIIVWDDFECITLFSHLNGGVSTGRAHQYLQESQVLHMRSYLQKNHARTFQDYKKEWMDPSKTY